MFIGTGILALLYLLFIVVIVVYLLVLATRFVKSHERGSAALEAIARKLDVGR